MTLVKLVDVEHWETATFGDDASCEANRLFPVRCSVKAGAKIKQPIRLNEHRRFLFNIAGMVEGHKLPGRYDYGILLLSETFAPIKMTARESGNVGFFELLSRTSAFHLP